MTTFAILFYLFLLIVWSIFLGQLPDKNQFQNYLYNIGYALFWGYTVIKYLKLIKLVPQAKTSFILLSMASGLFFAANSLWFYYNLQAGQEIPYPSTADLLWILFYIFTFLGSIPMLKSFGITFKASQVIETAVITTFIFIPLYSFLQTITSTSQLPLVQLLNFLYPFFDSLLVALFLTAIRTQIGNFNFQLLYFLFGFVFFILADTLFAFRTANETYWNGDGVDVIFAVAGACLALGVNSIPSLIQNKKTLI